jgi:hypothetical protein
MLKFYLRNFFLGMLLVASGEIMAQGFTASGSVKDARTGDAMPGVNVTVKGTTLGTVTDAEGNYSLQVESGTATLVFSLHRIPYIGNGCELIKLQCYR